MEMNKVGMTLLLFALSLPAFAGPYLISGKSNVTINGVSFSNPGGNCIEISNSSNINLINIRVTNCGGVGVSIYKSQGITVQRSYFEKMQGGVYADTAKSIKVLSNRFKNMDAQGGPRGQHVQFNNVTGSGNRIQSNRGLNEAGKSAPEDAINLFQSSGTADDPILVTDNCIKGGGPSTTGCGIIAGDQGGAYVLVQNNTLVNPGSCGIGVAGGHDIEINKNKVSAARRTWTNVGMYVWDQTDPATPCKDITVSENQVNWICGSVANGCAKGGEPNPNWDAPDDNCGVIRGWDNNQWYATFNPPLDCTF